MTLEERISLMEDLFDALEITPSLNEKRDCINMYIDEETSDDFNFCLEVLAGMHKLGYTYSKMANHYIKDALKLTDTMTIREVYETFLMRPLKINDLSEKSCILWSSPTIEYYDFFSKLADREYRIGIGKSLLEKTVLSPMLAKKFDPDKLRFSTQIFWVTEKLDGNRCIAKYNFNTNKWEFTSRNGKPMNVDFDCSKLDKYFVYDGEILQPNQVQMSEEIYKAALSNVKIIPKEEQTSKDFNSTSGLINSKASNKDLIYNIFDITNSGSTYVSRRKILNDTLNTETVRILPAFGSIRLDHEKCYENIYNLLDLVTGMGGEGLMFNVETGLYEQKRTDKLLKFKKVQSIDMRVEFTVPGTGKYLGLVGSLYCETKTSDGKLITSYVGSGLSDDQRLSWAKDKSLIVGSIVEVEYFSMSQSKDTSGTNLYSLRFPRLKRIRTDKNKTSEY